MLRVLTIQFLMVCSSFSFADGFAIEISGDYRNTRDPVRLDGKSASLKSGGAGLSLTYEHPVFGKLGAGAGYGRLSNQTASFAGIKLTGEASGNFYTLSYGKRWALPTHWFLDANIGTQRYDITGDLVGTLGELAVLADVDTRVTLSELRLGVGYHFLPSWSLTGGVGILDWDLDATARGSLGNSIRAMTKANGGGSEPSWYFGLEGVIDDLPVALEFSQSKIGADTETEQYNVKLSVTVPISLFN